MAALEAGGITQRIGSFTVKLEGVSEDRPNLAVFLDTPGTLELVSLILSQDMLPLRFQYHDNHSKFLEYASSCTDIVVLVVSAVDGIMPQVLCSLFSSHIQTIEAIQLARANGVTIVVAVNKMDILGADFDRIRSELKYHDLISDSDGGDVIMVPISAKTGSGLLDLTDAIALISDLSDLRTRTDGPSSAYILETRQERGNGVVCNIIVRSGTLRIGDWFLCGSQIGRVRSLIDQSGKPVEQALPLNPVQLLGLRSLVDLGDELVVVENEASAEAIANDRKRKSQEEEYNRSQQQDLRDRQESIDGKLLRKDGEDDDARIVAAPSTSKPVVPVVLKSDVRGSLEALLTYVSLLPSSLVTLQVVRASVGEITEGDIEIASGSGAKIFGFNVRSSPSSLQYARSQGVSIMVDDIIYKVMDGICDALSDKLPRLEVAKSEGRSEVRALFQIRGKKRGETSVCAGCTVLEGTLRKSHQYRVWREGVVVWQGVCRSLRHFKDEVTDIAKGNECGVILQLSVLAPSADAGAGVSASASVDAGTAASGADSLVDVRVGDHIECVSRGSVSTIALREDTTATLRRSALTLTPAIHISTSSPLVPLFFFFFFFFLVSLHNYFSLKT
jgi:translation initiation factor IF-2